MTDNKDLEAEIHPLKNEDRKSQENLGNQPKNEENLKSKPVQSRLSRCRTVAFFLSLFICLFVVFVVSFIIPCPDRPASQGMWKLDYNAAVPYEFLAMRDVNRDKIQDVLFLYKNTNSSNNFTRSCGDEGFSAPCAYVAAVSGANGSVLWERPVAQDVALVKCAVPPQSDSEVSSACILVESLGSFIAINFFTGETLWSHSSSLHGNASILSPLLQVPDIDGDGVLDLLILAREGQEVISIVLKYPRPTYLIASLLFFFIHFSLERIYVAIQQGVLPGLYILRATHTTSWEAPSLQEPAGLSYEWQNVHGLCVGWRGPAASMAYSYHASQASHAAQSHILPVGHSPQSTFSPDPKSVDHPLLCSSLKFPLPSHRAGPVASLLPFVTTGQRGYLFRQHRGPDWPQKQPWCGWRW